MHQTVQLTESEAWLLTSILQPPMSENGRKVVGGLMLKLFSLLNEFEARRSRPFPPTDLPIALDEDECWLLCHHVRPLTADGRAGKLAQGLVIKVSRLLLDLQSGEAVEALGLPRAEAAVDARVEADDLDRLRRFLRDFDGGKPDTLA